MNLLVVNMHFSDLDFKSENDDFEESSAPKQSPEGINCFQGRVYLQEESEIRCWELIRSF